MNSDTIKALTLMLMYLTSWEESLAPGIRRKPDHAGIHPQGTYLLEGVTETNSLPPGLVAPSSLDRTAPDGRLPVPFLEESE